MDTILKKEQGKILVDCYEDIMAAGLSGGCVYSWQDEWFKHTWNTMYAVDLSRNIYWEDAQTNDQHFGLLAFDCGGKRKCLLRGRGYFEWTDKDMVIQYEDGSFISVKYDASDVYLYLHKKDFDLENDTLYVPVDTTPKTGSTRMENCTAEFERPTDFVLILNGKIILVCWFRISIIPFMPIMRKILQEKILILIHRLGIALYSKISVWYYGMLLVSIRMLPHR